MSLNPQRLSGVGLITCGLGLWFAAIAPATSLAAGASYASMAPLGQYRTASRSDEIALARSAAPPSIANDADVLVLGEHGYETAAKGKNGFVCVVERGWAKSFDDDEFWNPKIRGPICFNAAGARSVLSTYLQRTGWVLAGASNSDMLARTKAAVAAKTLGAPESGAMCYMMSKGGYLSDSDGHWHSHLMFFLPHTESADWGADLNDSPVISAQDDVLLVTTFMVPVSRWSDGTLAAMPGH
jgi:hypothetical protein